MFCTFRSCCRFAHSSDHASSSSECARQIFPFCQAGRPSFLTKARIELRLSHDWKAAPGVVMETVKAAKSFIEAELAKYGTWEEAKKVSVCGHLFETSASFAQAKGEQGIGIRQIHAFLGKQWSRYLIENTLSVIRQEEDAERKKAEAYEAAGRDRESGLYAMEPTARIELATSSLPRMCSTD